jgi:hypothetical protein
VEQVSIAALRRLQRTVGNRAVVQMLEAERARAREDGEPAPAVVHEALRTPGSLLAPQVRAAMEAYFRRDFSRVRVHDRAHAAEASRALGARAFTVGEDIVFAERQYQPETGAGQRLLAHELAHTLQQPPGASREGLTILRDPSLERAAHDAAAGAVGSAPRAPAAAVQCYEAGEHVQFGGPAGDRMEYTVGKGTSAQKVTYSEIIALADLFESPKEMWKTASDEPEKFKKILELVRRERGFYEKKAGKTKVEEYEWQEATGGKYLNLAGKNQEHFASRNVAKWEGYHRQALKLALGGDMDKAYQLNAFGDHFLTDSFSAGHLIDKLAVVKDAENKLKGGRGPGRFLYTVRLAERMLSNPKTRERLAGYEVKIGDTWVPASSAESLAEVLRTVEASKPDEFYSGFAKSAHDWLNRDVGRSAIERDAEQKRLGLLDAPVSPAAAGKDPSAPGTGAMLQVTNERGDKWFLSGDTTLAMSPDTLRIAREAVARSRENVRWVDSTAASAQDTKRRAAMVENETPNMIAKVKAFIPIPTLATQAIIEKIKSTIANPLSSESITELVNVSEENFDTVLKELEGRGMVRRRRGGR